MDVDVELARMVRRVERQAERRVRESLERIGVEAEERAERMRRVDETRRSFGLFGVALAELRLGMGRFAASVSAGYEGRMHRG